MLSVATFLVVALLASIANGQGAARIPAYAPYFFGYDYRGDLFFLYSSATIVNGGEGGDWLTYLKGCQVNSNTWRFQTASPFINPPISWEANVINTYPDGGGYIFAIENDTVWDTQVVPVDQLMTDAINNLFATQMTPFQYSMFGQAVPLKSGDLPVWYTNVTLYSFEGWYATQYSNWSAQLSSLITVYVAGATGIPAGFEIPADLFQALTTQFLLFKTNHVNINRQPNFLSPLTNLVQPPIDYNAYLNPAGVLACP